MMPKAHERSTGIGVALLALALGVLTLAANGGGEDKYEVMAWSNTAGKRYLLSNDSCYQRYKQFLAADVVTLFPSPTEAEAAGFQRKVIVLVPLKKYADVCSPLYEYALATTCQKVFLSDRDEVRRRGFVPLEAFGTSLANVKVVGIVRSKTYLTPCDEGYECLNSQAGERTPECRALAMSTGKVRMFESERRARKEGYRSVAESYHSELDDKF